MQGSIPKTKASRFKLAKETVRNVVDAHKGVITVKNAGHAVGYLAGKIAIVGVMFYDGVYRGFYQQERKREGGADESATIS
jgi:hypothetical protein